MKIILTWEKYEAWVLQTTGCASLKQDVGELTIKNFSSNAQQAFEIYSNHDFWNEDLLPVLVWDNQLIVFGLQYNENLINIKNHNLIIKNQALGGRCEMRRESKYPI